MEEISASSLQNGHAQNGYSHVPKRLYSISRPPLLSSFQNICSQSTNHDTYPLAATVKSNVPIYDLATAPKDPASIDHLQDEWHHIILSGPGVFVLKNFYPDRQLLEHINGVFSAIIASETPGSKGDHFAASGKNARIWNSFQKHAERDPGSFVEYYSNPWLARVCEAWLGPAYQVTAQVNIVKPGGQPQVSHRDYHLGFQTAEACSQFPKATQIASQFLTLQGAVAHSDMPLESGPTRFLPFSQMFEEGFMAYRIKEFHDFFSEHWVGVELKMGDGVFFNPALFHAAGENQTATINRSANLLQISSAFGKTMERVDSATMIAKCWGDVTTMYAQAGTMTEDIHAILKAIGDGYPFPTNLDHRPPAPGGMAPESEIDILKKGLMQGWDTEQVVSAITTVRKDSLP
ncbi:uncharacterized protein Z518_00701 [Rhinocladiella mackenziei CBS 650.93]|uniref:Phytanoyl-CoA dioxygenase n=1 Tax=Rhinocladiella mackenziei CBS 650.93 TaxID=1442369 RepID=A0A0D2J1Q8_9EURO|nr:uncharacterized protein Z518_00701 [Rhinocladiella mackenziei CBS 650.93]KIX09621.1 hypothetical protein Z518_00701 [Rhinocladiella mackenziei CBS 650.93]